MRDKWKDPVYRAYVMEKRREANKRPEVRAMRSKIALENWQDPEFLEKQRIGRANADYSGFGDNLREISRRPEVRAFHSERMTALMQDPVYAGKVVAGTTEYWSQRDHLDEQSERGRAAIRKQGGKTSKPELQMGAMLKGLGLEPIHQPDIPGYGGIPDYLIPRWRAIVEVDGVWWHGLPGVPEKDIRKTAALRALGYSVIRIADTDITDRPQEVTRRLQMELGL